ncbi:bifunctional (p)ppGpp synthetase/guanosine-3',5'-bis(diphosphate) 3'-pyrophosphohydrolase [Parvularcula sp. LCG005]|uniref:RelA/SpoT family protein n=1 Tax=Parvularcula sp. LCG005 TaxID=3078805 RepID=UPI0029438263|nr:bifunctional (p)ppGpp synthetase/guanosine-3',5'-bis(diphosphate) 3'-pyrophosphohydrolase [Parvularcula sp. LCG005]WOI54253.1 bifunctional (p)ppGpp synthetase/guanosine-3',5'-bis(diphosphate) 3'-pyrophosphohydrolase [Parvularcula sp. LCG005]
MATEGTPPHETEIPSDPSTRPVATRGGEIRTQDQLSQSSAFEDRGADVPRPAATAESHAIGTSGPPPGFIRQYELVDLVKSYDPHADEDLLNKAYVFAMRAHGEQKRSSGDPYFTHPLAVAAILTDLRLDPATIATALLHDVVEDTDVSIKDIENAFGPEVARLVDGVTKISKRELAPDTDGKAENFAKFILATAKDVRVLLVKLADRLHNMRTLNYISKVEKRERIARETMEIYAPMAGRIGVQQVKEELEDLSFRYLNPGAFDAIQESLTKLAEDKVRDVVALAQTLRVQLADAGLSAEIYSREKRAFSIWRKMQRKRSTFEELADIYAFRVLVDSVEDCYRALGIIHRAFPMIPGEFDDYISTPKPNGYQSIHTAVIASRADVQGQRVEVQIRSKDMHDTAERGVAAHWRYKDQTSRQGGGDSVELGRDGRYSAYDWLRGVIETLNTDESGTAFLEQARIDLYHDQVFPFTPKGRVIPLPIGATALDFAYALHTEIGDRFSGAKINGVRRPNRTPLRNGDVVTVLKSDHAAIPTGWESFVVTGAAKSGIRRRIRQLQRQEQYELGERIIASTFGARDLPFSAKALEDAGQRLGFATTKEFYEAVGRMDVSGRTVLQTVFPNLDMAPTDAVERSLHRGDNVPRGIVSLAGVTPGAAVRLGTCCGPLPGERIVGVKGENGAIMAHRIDCERLAHADDEEWLNLSWTFRDNTQFAVPIVITVNNRTGALGHIGSMLARYGVDIVDLRLEHREVDFSDLCVDIAVRDAKHLNNVLTGLRASNYVVAADRVEETG